MATIKPLFSIFFLTICLFSCNKEEIKDPGVPPKTKTDLLTQLPWRKYSNVICTEVLKECEKDDRYSFRKDGKLVRTFGFLQCNVGEADELDNTWFFSADEKSLTVNYTFWGQSIYNVDSLTEDKLVLSILLPGCTEVTTYLH